MLMGQRFNIFTARKWQLSVTLGGEPPEPLRETAKIFLPPVTGKAAGLRVIWPDKDQVNLDRAGCSVGPEQE